jgi:tRNA(Arg) A34 adenosine deaminase TadA
MSDEQWLRAVVDRATRNVVNGGGPFGAVVVRDGEAIAYGVNQVTQNLDPTAHAEVVAIRAACQALGTFSLAGCVVYSSCEPCPMCLAAALWARVDRVVFAATRDDAAASGFDDRAFYELFDGSAGTWPAGVEWHQVAGATAPFEAWLGSSSRVEY